MSTVDAALVASDEPSRMTSAAKRSGPSRVSPQARVTAPGWMAVGGPVPGGVVAADRLSYERRHMELMLSA